MSSLKSSRLKSLGKATLVVSLALVLTAIVVIGAHVCPILTFVFVILGMGFVIYLCERGRR